jgi:hypothetical protein
MSQKFERGRRKCPRIEYTQNRLNECDYDKRYLDVVVEL